MKTVIILIAALFVPGGLIYSQDAAVPPYGMSELEAYSIFYDAYRTGDYELALTYGVWIVASTPRAMEGYDGFSLETQLRRMNTVYSEMVERTADEEQRRVNLLKAAGIFATADGVLDEGEVDAYDLRMRR